MSKRHKKRRINKGSNNEKENKKQKLKKYKIFVRRHQKDYWYLKIKYFFYYNLRYITAKYVEKSSSTLFFDKKKLYYMQKVT